MAVGVVDAEGEKHLGIHRDGSLHLSFRALGHKPPATVGLVHPLETPPAPPGSLQRIYSHCCSPHITVPGVTPGQGERGHHSARCLQQTLGE
jgi:hypothetical protein